MYLTTIDQPPIELQLLMFSLWERDSMFTASRRSKLLEGIRFSCLQQKMASEKTRKELIQYFQDEQSL